MEVVAGAAGAAAGGSGDGAPEAAGVSKAQAPLTLAPLVARRAQEPAPTLGPRRAPSGQQVPATGHSAREARPAQMHSPPRSRRPTARKRHGSTISSGDPPGWSTAVFRARSSRQAVSCGTALRGSYFSNTFRRTNFLSSFERFAERINDPVRGPGSQTGGHSPAFLKGRGVGAEGSRGGTKEWAMQKNNS